MSSIIFLGILLPFLCCLQCQKYEFIATWGGNFISRAVTNESYHEPSLRTLCTNAPQYSKVHIYAVNAHYGYKMYPGMVLENHCNKKAFETTTNTSFPLLECPAVAIDVLHCQKRGIKVLITVANVSSTIIETDEEGEERAVMMWNLFLGGQDNYRPFGDVVLDGVDLMIRDSSKGYLKYAQKLRQLMNADQSRKYLLSISPVASFSDAYSGPGRTNTVLSHPELFDYICLFAMSSPDCTARNSNQFWDTLWKWQEWIGSSCPANGPTLILALPASDAVSGVASPGDFVSVSRIATPAFQNNIRKVSRITGFLIFDYSIDNVSVPCKEYKKTYSQLFSVLMNGKVAEFKCTPSPNQILSNSSDQDGENGIGSDDDVADGAKPKEKFGLFKGNPFVGGQTSSADNAFKSMRFGFFVVIVVACWMF